MGRIWDTVHARFLTEDERDALSYRIRKQKMLAKTEHEMISLAVGIIIIIKSYIIQPRFRVGE